jgi:hemerythrin
MARLASTPIRFWSQATLAMPQLTLTVFAFANNKQLEKFDGAASWWDSQTPQFNESREKLTTLEWMAINKVSAFKVGDQHLEWFQLANSFLFADGQREKLEAGKAFLHFTFQHFACEETKMRGARFPFVAAHIEDHERLLRTFNKILDIADDVALSRTELEEFMGYCLKSHISYFDDQLDLFIRRSSLV